MANEVSGLSALDPRVAATEKFIQEKKIPPDQVANFLMTMGADPRLAGLVLKYQRLKQAGQDQAKDAPASTVAQDIDSQLQRQQGVASLPAPVMDNAQFAGGGVVALAGGGSFSPSTANSEIFDWDTWNNAYKEAQRTGDTSKMAALKAWAEKNLPNFSRYAEKVAPTVTKYGTKLVKGAPAVGAAAGFYGVSQSDPESIQSTSRLAQLGLMDVDPSSKTKTVLSSLTGVAESMIPFAGLFYDTPLDRAEALTDKKVERINKGASTQFNLNPEEAAIGQEFNRIVREYGVDSREAKDFEARYRAAMGRASPAAEDELARIMAQSAAGSGTQRASGVGMPRIPGVTTPATESREVSELRGRLKGMEDVSKPEAREAAIDREIAARMKRYTDMGIMKPFDDAKANVQSRLKELDGIKDKNFYKAMAMMGFTMAGTRGSFFQALAAGGAAGLSAYETFEERRQATLDKLQDRMMNIDMGIANIKERAGAGAEARVDKLESERNRVQDQITTLNHAESMLARTQGGQLAVAQMQIAADAARDEARFGGLGKELEQEILRYRAIAGDPKQKPDIRAAAKAKVEALYKERERATQAGSGSFQSAALKAMAGQIPGYNYPMVGSEQGGASDDIDALVAQYLK